MNVTVLIVCTALSRADVPGEFSRVFLVFRITKYLLRMQCIGNIMWNKDLALAMQPELKLN